MRRLGLLLALGACSGSGLATPDDYQEPLTWQYVGENNSGSRDIDRTWRIYDADDEVVKHVGRVIFEGTGGMIHDDPDTMMTDGNGEVPIRFHYPELQPGDTAEARACVTLGTSCTPEWFFRVHVPTQ